jgi:nitrite reductase (NO-forming)
MVGTLTIVEGAVGTPAADAGDGAATSAEVDMVDLAFNPTEITIVANTDVTITAVNNGVLPHTFTITDVADTGDVLAGDSASVTVNLAPGEYKFICAVPGHEAAGMVGTLIVK